MTQLLLVRWPDRRRPPAGTFGRFEVLGPRTYVSVDRDEEFEAWAVEQGIASDCGHVPRARKKLVKRRAEEAFAAGAQELPPGMRAHTDGRWRLRVWPMGVRNVDRLSGFLWESAVVVERDGARARSARRARWRR